ncbi:Hypothetical protein CINCED_3A011079 [Cinara cedri]|uniref:Uncharacterized protein n=1 Tax=Cinara cedri TaxID=506608 RepID=A0A5E4NPM1_9HEMI|nr:Hypothetical protein CINCED_3A011079 [Cinara cedri]
MIEKDLEKVSPSLNMEVALDRDMVERDENGDGDGFKWTTISLRRTTKTSWPLKKGLGPGAANCLNS